MESVNRAGPIAAGVALLHDSSRPLLAQAARAQGAADREALPPAPKAVTLQLGGHRLTAVPIGPPGKGGKTLYEVTWQGIAVRTVLTGQIGPRQFEPGSPLKRQLEQALAARSRGPGWLRPLENAGEALTGWVQDIVDPPLGRVRPWRGNVAGARVTARPLRADGERITWRIDVERGGQPAGTFEAVLSGQLGEAQFRPLRGGGVSPLKAQVLDVLRAPQKRLQDLAETVVLRDAPGGETLEATVVAMQRLRGGRWQTVGYAVGEIRGWSDRPGHPGQRPQALGYLRRSVHRGERITLTDGTPAASVAQARTRVLEMLEHRGLSLVSSAGARAAAETRRQQSADVADLAARLGAAGPARLGRWSAPVPLPKPLEQMTAAERIQYTVRVARQTLPADVARQLQSLITPQTAAALAAYAAAHALGLGFIADGVALGLSGPDAVEGVRQFARYLRTALQARHAMELSEAGRQLSELAAPLVVNGGAMLATFGAGRAARARRGRPPAPRAAAVTPATPNRRGPSVGSAAAPTTATVRVERTSGHPLF